MALGRYNNRRDANEQAIFDVLRGYGFSVHSLDTPADALVGFKGVTRLVEIKVGDAKYTTTQIKFQEHWRGDYITLRSVEEAEAWCKDIRGV